MEFVPLTFLLDFLSVSFSFEQLLLLLFLLWLLLDGVLKYLTFLSFCFEKERKRKEKKKFDIPLLRLHHLDTTTG
jgi:hypothetical protein